MYIQKRVNADQCLANVNILYITGWNILLRKNESIVSLVLSVGWKYYIPVCIKYNKNAEKIYNTNMPKFISDLARPASKR